MTDYLLSHKNFYMEKSKIKQNLSYLFGVSGDFTKGGSASFGNTVTTVVDDEVAAASEDGSLLRQNIPASASSEVGGSSS